MLKRQSKYSKKLLPLLAGLFLLYGISRMKKSSPAQAINRVFRGSKYEYLIPLLIAQAKHETGNFQSNLFRNHNNMFGMKIPRSRTSFRNGQVTLNGETFSTFASLEQSAKDQLAYLEAVNFPRVNDSFEFVAALQNRGYFTDNFGNYLKGVQSWL
jgi:hypothetical protein